MARAPTYSSHADLKRRKPFRRWHEAIIDDLIMFPLSSLEERAARLRKYSPNYLSIIMNSDMIIAAYNARRKEFNDRLNGSIVNKAAQAVDRSFDIILEKLEKKRDEIPFQQLTDFTDKTLERLGYGVKQAPAAQVNISPNIQVATVTPEALEEARAALRASESARATNILNADPALRADADPLEPGAAAAPRELLEERPDAARTSDDDDL